MNRTSFVMFAAALSWAAAACGKPSMEARVQALLDEKQICDLLITYGHRFDTLDLVGYSQLFSANGQWKGNYGGSYVIATGPAEVLAMMRRVLGTPHFDASKVNGFHLMTNFFVHVNGDHADAQSRWTYFARDKENKLLPALAGHYDDSLIREGGVWKFLERRVSRDLPPEE